MGPLAPAIPYIFSAAMAGASIYSQQKASKEQQAQSKKQMQQQMSMAEEEKKKLEQNKLELEQKQQYQSASVRGGTSTGILG